MQWVTKSHYPRGRDEERNWNQRFAIFPVVGGINVDTNQYVWVWLETYEWRLCKLEGHSLEVYQRRIPGRVDLREFDYTWAP